MARNSLLGTQQNLTLDDVVAYIERNSTPTIKANVDVGTLTLGELEAFIQNGITYTYDPTATQGTGVSLTTLKDATGRVYRAVGTNEVANQLIYNVRSNINDQPANPRRGDTHIIYDQAGNYLSLWASQRVGFFAVYTGRRWLFFPPINGKPIWNETTQTNWQYRNNVWVEGVDGRSISDRTVPNTVLRMPFGAHVLSVNEVNAPPQNASNGDSYIVARTGATGVFAGLENRFVQFFNGEWRVGIENYVGATVSDLDTGRNFRWNGTNWERIDNTILESFAGAIGGHANATATVIGTGPTARSGWILDGGSFIPPLRRSGDWIKCQLLPGGHNIAHQASDQIGTSNRQMRPTQGNDIASSTTANGEFAVQCTTQTPQENRPEIRFRYSLIVLIGPTNAERELTDIGVLGSGEGRIVNWKASQSYNGNTGRGVDTVYTYDDYLPQSSDQNGITARDKTQAGSLHHSAYDVMSFDTFEGEKTAILQGNSGDPIKFAIVMDEVFIGSDKMNRANPPVGFETELTNADLSVRSDLTLSARNISANISWQYFTNSFE